jgi:hypothetical protein
MEYMILTLSTSKNVGERLINELAAQGWRVICPLADYRLILGREKIETRTESK